LHYFSQGRSGADAAVSEGEGHDREIGRESLPSLPVAVRASASLPPNFLSRRRDRLHHRRRQAALDAAIKQIGSRAVAVKADAAKLADLMHLFDTVKAAKGRIDVLFANAGIYESRRRNNYGRSIRQDVRHQREGRAGSPCSRRYR